MKKQKKFDLIIVSLLLILAAFVWWFFELMSLIGGLIFVLLPVGYMLWREKKNYVKLFWGVLILGILLGFVFDFIEVFNKAWIVNLTLPWEIFGIVSVDNLIGYGIMSLLIIVFYEHFLDDEKNGKINREGVKKALMLSIIATISLVVVFIIKPDLLKIRYAYLVGGSLAIIVPIVFMVKNKKMVLKFLLLAVYFFCVWFIAEIVALKTNGWVFPGEYIGRVEIFGVFFPFEELFFWMMWYAIAVVSYYELAIDDKA